MMSDPRRLASLLVIACGMFLTAAAHAQTVWYVNDEGDAGNGCTSWHDACPELQSALSLASDGNQIWVAEGTYRPDYDTKTGQHTGNREASFQLISGVEMYGGFNGTESSRKERAELFDQTILSGDLNGDDQPRDFPGGMTFEDNSCHVMIASGVDAFATLDGFTVTGGNADTSNCANGSGAGLLNDGASLTLTNCSFAVNSSIFMIKIVTNSGGAGIWNSGHSNLTDCTFVGNSLIISFAISNNSGGGAIWNSGNATLTNCVLSGNEFVLNGSATTNTGGGGLHNSGDPVLNACAFNQNAATGGSSKGGGMWNSGGPTLTDCTFQGNSVSGPIAKGGGMYQEGDGSAQITRSTFRENFILGGIAKGGGLYLDGGDLALTECAFVGNFVDSQAGGLWQQPDTMMTLTDCTFKRNTAGGSSGDGGGIAAAGSYLISNCSFIENSAIVRGGGMYSLTGLDGGETRLITDCTFRNNSAVDGAGMFIIGDSTTMHRCIFAGNIAPYISGIGSGRGGGLFVGADETIVTLTNCLLAGNSALEGLGSARGGGIFVADDPIIVLTNCTLYGNWCDGDGGAVYSYLSPGPPPITFANCIVWANGAGDEGPGIFGFAEVSHSNVQGGWAGIGNIDVDPLFVDPDGPDNVPGNEDDDLRLQPGSPCIDAADGSAVPPDIETDLDGNPRFVDDPDTDNTGAGNCPFVDMGAFEYQEGVAGCCPADFDGDGGVGASDLAQLLGSWGPYEPCPPFDAADFNEDCGVNAADLAQLLGSWGPCP